MKRAATIEAPAVLILAEIAGAVVVIATVCGLLIQFAEVVVFKASFTEVMLALAIEKVDVTEQLAVAGLSPRDTPDASTTRVTTKPPERVTISVSDHGISASGTVKGREFTLGMRPAVAGVAEDWSIVWLCGEREPPAGWVAPPAAGPVKLPATFVGSACRSASPR